MMKKTMSLLLALVLLCSCACSCALAESPSPRSSNYFISYGTSMSAIGNGQVYISFKAVGTTICTQIGVACYQVQKLNDDGIWQDVSGLLPGEMGSNMVTYCFARIFQGVPGETYRLQVTFYSAIGTGCEFKIYTSGTLTAR